MPPIVPLYFRSQPPLTPMTTTTVEVCFAYFLPTDARHWIPNGTAWVNLTVPEEWFDCDQSEWEDLLTESAEALCESTHGKGSFWGMIWED